MPESGLNDPSFDLMAWLGKHGQDVTRPHIDNVMKALSEQGVKSFAASGYCFGGRYVVDLVVDVSPKALSWTVLPTDADAGCRAQPQDKLKVAIASHPSLLKVPDDLEAVKKHSVPFLWNTCETDNQVSSCSGA